MRPSARKAPLFVEQAGGDYVRNIGPLFHLNNGIVAALRHAVIAVVFAVGDGESGIQNISGWIQRIGIDESRIVFGGVVLAGRPRRTGASISRAASPALSRSQLMQGSPNTPMSAANSPPGQAGSRINLNWTPTKAAEHPAMLIMQQKILIEWPWRAGVRHKVVAVRAKAIRHVVMAARNGRIP